MNIVICDDSESDAATAKEAIMKTADELHVVAEVDYYSNAEDIEKKLLDEESDVDLLILDIDMPEVSGLDIAERIRDNNNDLLIIFLSNHEEFVFRAIEFQPFRYIRKIKLDVEMPLAIRSAAKIIESRADKPVVIDTDNGEIKIMTSEIMYLEAYKRKTTIHLKSGENCLSKINISEILNLINNDKFIMIHRSCAVNADFIKALKNDIIIMKNNKPMLITRSKVKDVKQKILRLWGDKI